MNKFIKSSALSMLVCITGINVGFSDGQIATIDLRQDLLTQKGPMGELDALATVDPARLASEKAEAVRVQILSNIDIGLKYFDTVEQIIRSTDDESISEMITEINGGNDPHDCIRDGYKRDLKCLLDKVNEFRQNAQRMQECIDRNRNDVTRKKENRDEEIYEAAKKIGSDMDDDLSLVAYKLGSIFRRSIGVCREYTSTCLGMISRFYEENKNHPLIEGPYSLSRVASYGMEAYAADFQNLVRYHCFMSFNCGKTDEQEIIRKFASYINDHNIRKFEQIFGHDLWNEINIDGLVVSWKPHTSNLLRAVFTQSVYSDEVSWDFLRGIFPSYMEFSSDKLDAQRKLIKTYDSQNSVPFWQAITQIGGRLKHLYWEVSSSELGKKLERQLIQAAFSTNILDSFSQLKRVHDAMDKEWFIFPMRAILPEARKIVTDLMNDVYVKHAHVMSLQQQAIATRGRSIQRGIRAVDRISALNARLGIEFLHGIGYNACRFSRGLNVLQAISVLTRPEMLNVLRELPDEGIMALGCYDLPTAVYALTSYANIPVEQAKQLLENATVRDLPRRRMAITHG
ncbi:MAG: hypothetical protein LBQ43_02210 [Holosporales bacterium]|jgi:hypothetical protein|nr:hypothetical protein [Holosporales bacterium]